MRKIPIESVIVMLNDWIRYRERILPFCSGKDLDENLEILADLKAKLRNKKIQIIFKKD